MKYLTFAMVLFASAAAAQDSTPFAQQPYKAGSEVPLIGLSEVMAISQMRHIKLWQAAKVENWPLAAYEADKLRDSLYRAANFYVNIPVPLVKSADEPLSAIQDAATRRDLRAFEKAFGDLTTSCNACHQAAGLEFIRMRTPSASPFSDQDFAPVKKTR
jgi:mono/diheme cytochrome c family protein